MKQGVTVMGQKSCDGTIEHGNSRLEHCTETKITVVGLGTTVMSHGITLIRQWYTVINRTVW